MMLDTQSTAVSGTNEVDRFTQTKVYLADMHKGPNPSDHWAVNPLNWQP